MLGLVKLLEADYVKDDNMSFYFCLSLLRYFLNLCFFIITLAITNPCVFNLICSFVHFVI